MVAGSPLIGRGRPDNHIDTQDQKEKTFDWSWLKKEHLDDLKDIVGLAYHANNITAFNAHLSDGWSHNKNNNASIENVPGWGGKCTILYNVHRTLHASDGITPDIITIEGVFNEESIIEYEHRPAHATHMHQAKLIINNIEKPTYVVDVGPGKFHNIKLAVGSALAESVIVLAGITIAEKSPATLSSTALVSYLSGGMISNVGALVGQVAGGTTSDITAALMKTTNEIPTIWALLLLKIRNVIAAEKNEWLAHLYSEKIGRPIHLATVWGSAHTGIEAETLRPSEERIAFLERWRPLIKLLYMKSSESAVIWTCVRLEHSLDNLGRPLEKVEGPHIEVGTLKKIFSS